MERTGQAEVPGARAAAGRFRRPVDGLASPAICAVIGCGDRVLPGRGHLYCGHCLSVRGGDVPSGPTDENELDASVPSSRPMGLFCAFADCAQPSLLGRLYCSERCRRRAQSRKTKALFVIDGVEATLREHARTRGLDYGTVWCRLRSGATPEEAVTIQPTRGRPRKAA